MTSISFADAAASSTETASGGWSGIAGIAGAALPAASVKTPTSAIRAADRKMPFTSANSTQAGGAPRLQAEMGVSRAADGSSAAPWRRRGMSSDPPTEFEARRFSYTGRFRLPRRRCSCPGRSPRHTRQRPRAWSAAVPTSQRFLRETLRHRIPFRTRRLPQLVPHLTGCALPMARSSLV